MKTTKFKTIKFQGSFLGLTYNPNMPGLAYTSWRKSDTPVHLTTPEYNRLISLLGKLAEKVAPQVLTIEIAGGSISPAYK